LVSNASPIAKSMADREVRGSGTGAHADQIGRGQDLHRDRRVACGEAAQARHEPTRCESAGRTDSKAGAPPAMTALNRAERVFDLLEGLSHSCQQFAACAGKPDGAVATLEQRHAEPRL